jgi:lactoylglutathione lyase
MAPTLNHVSIIATDLEASARFYVDELGLEPLPTPNFGFPVLWLRAGDRQLHLFERPGVPRRTPISGSRSTSSCRSTGA